MGQISKNNYGDMCLRSVPQRFAVSWELLKIGGKVGCDE